ncbi:hypothetical protein [[Mycobacterium] wendilense]|uniref:CAP domain-containing protein n=1 Tax=[Mycobacterium] wendilense TaxID=3064284 RepID=A0ABN9NXS6_9MYCO|nr:hypothetical protein [Mycolicibacterium sp. MU0050]CAJ1579450.1 hypothetical protein MU0050_000514 [Mycolicibacterium sp. MU0050]
MSADDSRMSVVNRRPRTLAVPAVLLCSGLLCAAPALAEDNTRFDAGIAAVRAAGPCPALAHDPLAQRAAELSNRSTADYLGHTADHVPVTDPLFVLHDLGSDAERAIQLQGQGSTAGDAIKGALLQGHSAIPDCAYNRFGTSVLHTDAGRTVVVAVLAG